MRKAFHDGLKQYVKKRTSKVVEIDENGTSLLCPKCHHSSKKIEIKTIVSTVKNATFPTKTMML